MYTGNYDFQAVNPIKIILGNEEGKILLLQEPKTNTWMPLHWGLPGGKPTETESLLETVNRKIKTDIGIDVTLEGIYKIEELLIKGRTPIMYIFVASCKNTKVMGEAKEYKWVSKEDVAQMSINKFTEYYNKALLLEYFDNPTSRIPLNIIKTWEYYKMSDQKEYKQWLESGKNS